MKFESLKQFNDQSEHALFFVGCTSEMAERLYFSLPTDEQIATHEYVAVFNSVGQKVAEFKIDSCSGESLSVT